MLRALTLILIDALAAACASSAHDARSVSAPSVKTAASAARESDAPIINSHLHSAYLHMEDADYLQTVVAEMNRHDIARSVLHINEPSDLEDWVDAAPGRFLAGPTFPCWKNAEGAQAYCDWDGGAWPDLDWMRENYLSGRMRVMGEMMFVYAGVAPTDARMEPYWALAAELNIPVAVHINRGPPPNSPSRRPGCCPDFNADYGNPALLRPVLEKHPDLKIWLQHAGFPALPMFDDIDYLEETYALLADYPNVFVDMTALNAAVPPPVHEAAVRAFVVRGFGGRIMMGTDNWEAAPIIERYDAFDFLSADEKRAILHGNAARFFAME
ncbi:MAG: amidohydrolase family protein [Pseudomonadota bacterium]